MTLHSRCRFMSLHELATRWAPSAKWSIADLISELMSSILNGELDNVPVDGGVMYGICFIDIETREASPTISAKIHREAERLHQAGTAPVLFFRLLIDNGIIGITREAAIAFSVSRGIKPPPFWSRRQTVAARKSRSPSLQTRHRVKKRLGELLLLHDLKTAHGKVMEEFGVSRATVRKLSPPSPRRAGHHIRQNRAK